MKSFGVGRTEETYIIFEIKKIDLTIETLYTKQRETSATPQAPQDSSIVFTSTFICFKRGNIMAIAITELKL